MIGRKPMLTPSQVDYIREVAKRRAEIPTISDLAKELGVSRDVVIRAQKFDLKHHVQERGKLV